MRAYNFVHRTAAHEYFKRMFACMRACKLIIRMYLVWLCICGGMCARVVFGFNLTFRFNVTLLCKSMHARSDGCSLVLVIM